MVYIKKDNRGYYYFFESKRVKGKKYPIPKKCGFIGNANRFYNLFLKLKKLGWLD